MFLLDKKMYYKMKDLIPQNDIVYSAIINQIQDGMIYVDNPVQPQAFFIRNSSGAYFVGGNMNNTQFVEWLIEYLKDTKNHKVYYDLSASSSEWLDYLEKQLLGNVVRLGRVNLEYNENLDYKKIDRIDLPESYHLVEMDEKLYEKYVADVDNSYATLFTSAHDFVTRSFGYCILHDDKFVSTCNAYHINKNIAEVDVWTNRNYRNNGYATIVVNAFVDHCKKRNLQTQWNADKGNAISIHLAKKCGFEKTFEEDELWWHQDKWQIDQYLKKYGYTN